MLTHDGELDYFIHSNSFFDFVLSYAGGLFKEGGHILLDEVGNSTMISVSPCAVLVSGG